MRFEVRTEPGVTLSGDTNDIAPEKNLILQAAAALGQPDRGAHIHIQKRIPRGGGLGGGSSNAATTLLVLNRLWGLGLEQDALQRLATPLGADVPVFVMGQSAWAEGVGDVLSALTLPKRWFVIAQPDCTVSTAEIFADPALTRHTTPDYSAGLFFRGWPQRFAGRCAAALPRGSASVGMASSALPGSKNDWQWRLRFCRAGDRGISAPNCGRGPGRAVSCRGRGRGQTPRNAGS